MKDVFTLGMRSTQLSESLNNDLKIHFKSDFEIIWQLSESLNNDLKIHFKSDFEIIRFFKHFERVVQGKRNNELNSEFLEADLYKISVCTRVSLARNSISLQKPSGADE
jgi:hypothetical protein